MTSEQLMEVNKVIEDCGLENVEDYVLIKSGATNGDVIKALFPNAKVSQSKIEVYMKMGVEDTDIQCFDIEWWNSSYQKGWKNENSN